MSDPRRYYHERHDRHREASDRAGRRSLVLSNVRAGTFVAIVASVIVLEGLTFPTAWVPLGIALALAVAFVVQVIVHRRVRREERWEAALAAVAREGVLRLDRDWEALEASLPPAERPPEDPSPDHPFARDLSVTGRASLVRLAGPVTSERGRALLRSWLLAPAPQPTARARQGALGELTPLADLRAEVAARGRLEEREGLGGLDGFLRWAEDDHERLPQSLVLAAWVLPPLTVGGVVGYFALAWPLWWIVPALAQVYALRRHRHRLTSTLRGASVGGPALRAHVPQLELLSLRAWSDELLASLSSRLGRGDDTAHRRLGRLSALLDSVESRRNAFYAMVAPVLMLDIHLCAALERWRAAHGRSVRDWLDALGEWEALASLATLAHDHPDWAYPTLEAAATELAGRALGHPLLAPDRCVRNDVRVGPPETFLLVTGSNMSGKSTLLRAIGTNAVLAAAGAPVCASALSLPPLRVHTSMRVEDSLEAGVSLFMAELLRIKGVVEAADRARSRNERVLYLLDEILHGTNTAERRIAARSVLRHLLAAGAIGAVSTHDLTLADAPDLASAAHAVHFREEVERACGPAVAATEASPRAALTFDYLLRDGIATTRNALKLLSAVGLGGLELDEG